MKSRGNDLVLGSYPDGRPIVLSAEHRLQHMSVVGQTGSGKSKFIEFLIRQDLRAWPRTHAGLMLIDPHGELFDNILAWLAANRLHHLPIVPIDARRTDRIVSYNPLRERAGQPSVIIDNFVKVMCFVWGAAGSDQTPLFERWATNTLHRLYVEKKTLADASHLFTPEGYVAVDKIDDVMIRRDWAVARRDWKNFERDTLSAVNRFRRFLLNPVMRAMFGQTSTSLDLSRALDEGQIILVCLGRKRGNISQENGDLLATLLISDFWMALEERGKADHHRPYYLYLDEFQRFTTPSMAESLAEMRGHRCGLVLANQFPRQVYNAGPHGPRIYDEIRENARTKIAFRQRSLDNMQIVANELFFGTFNPLRVKHQHSSTKVLGHLLRYLPSFSYSGTAARGGGSEHSVTRGSNRSIGRNWSHTETEGSATMHSVSDTIGESLSTSDSWSESSGETVSDVRSGGQSITRNDAIGQTIDESVDEPVDDLVRKSSGLTETDSSGWNKAASQNRNSMRGGGTARALTATRAESEATTETLSSADTEGGSETSGTSEADTSGESISWSKGRGQSISFSPMLIPQFGQEADTPIFWPLDEQTFLAMKKLFLLKDREAYILAGEMKRPVRIRTPDVNHPDIARAVVEVAVGWFQRESGVMIPFDQAMQRIRERDCSSSATALLTAADADFAPSE